MVTAGPLPSTVALSWSLLDQYHRQYLTLYQTDGSCYVVPNTENKPRDIRRSYVRASQACLWSTTNKMQHFLDLFISINCCTCFRRFLRPSSGAQNCTYSVRYCQTNTAAIVDEMELSSISSTVAAVLVWQYLTLYVQFCAPDDGRRNRLKHVQQFTEIDRSRKCCILLVVL